MKLKALVVMAALFCVGLLSGKASAETVSVSSSAVTTMLGSNAGRKSVCLQNQSYLNVYFSKYSSSATATAGMVLAGTDTYHAVQNVTCLPDYSGPLYGKSQGTASVDVRYTETAR